MRNDRKSKVQSQDRARATHRPQPRSPVEEDNEICYEEPYERERGEAEDAGLQFQIHINGTNQPINVQELSDREIADDLERRCRLAKEPVIVFFDGLLSYSNLERWTVLEFVGGLEHYRVGVGTSRHDNMFEATLALMTGNADMKLFERGKLAALEAAILLFPTALDGACGRIVERLRELGVRGIKVADVVRDARKILKALQSRPTSPETQDREVRAILPNAPVTEGVVVPPGWLLSIGGVERCIGQGGLPKLASPVILTGRGTDVRRSKRLVTLAWHADGRWHQQVYDRDVVASTRSVVELAADGLPVNSNNAKEFVQYVADFEAANAETLPLSQVSRQMGWYDVQGNQGFLWGTQIITADGVHDSKCAAEDTSEDTSRSVVRFRGADEGDEQIARGFHARGKLEKWLQAIRPLADYPRVRLALYASLSAPLLDILNSPNYILSFAGPTTGGKTTTLRIGASVWGNPDEDNPSKVMASWDSTPVFRERAPAVLNNLPLILDDTKRVRFKEDVPRTIYDFGQGQGRGRGSVKGLARQETWRSVLLMSGEQPATSFSGDGGTRARVLELWGSPFGAMNQETGQVIQKLNHRIGRHYGHAGSLFVAYLLKNRDRWNDWAKGYRKRMKAFEALAGDNVVAGRLCAHFAAITAAAWIAHRALGLPWGYSNPILPLWHELIQEASEADRATIALRHVVGVAQASPDKFFDMRRAKKNLAQEPPHNGWWGRWDRREESLGGNRTKSVWPWIGFLPHQLKQILLAGEFEPDSILRTWKDRGWIIPTMESGVVQRYQKKAKVGREPVWLVQISREAIEANVGV